MSVKLLTEHHLEVLNLKWVVTGLSESTLMKMPHCWRSHVATQMFFIILYSCLICLDLQKSVTAPKGKSMTCDDVVSSTYSIVLVKPIHSVPSIVYIVF